MKPTVDPETEDKARGEFLASFCEEIEGESLQDISSKAEELAKKYSREWKEDVQVFEIPM